MRGKVGGLDGDSGALVTSPAIIRSSLEASSVYVALDGGTQVQYRVERRGAWGGSPLLAHWIIAAPLAWLRWTVLDRRWNIVTQSLPHGSAMVRGTCRTKAEAIDAIVAMVQTPGDDRGW